MSWRTHRTNTCRLLRRKCYKNRIFLLCRVIDKSFILSCWLLMACFFFFLGEGRTKTAINVFIMFFNVSPSCIMSKPKRFFFCSAHEFPLRNWTVWVMLKFVKLRYTVRNWIIGFSDAMARPSVSPFVTGKGSRWWWKLYDRDEVHRNSHHDIRSVTHCRHPYAISNRGLNVL